MDSVFGIFFGALAIIAFGACIGAGLRGRPGRLFGLAILKIGLVCLFVLLLFVDSFPHNEIILWLVLMLMAGALICFGGPPFAFVFPAFLPYPFEACASRIPFFSLSGRRGGRASAIGWISRFSPMALGNFSF